MSDPPAQPKPAASVLLVRPSPPAAPEPVEVYMIRRHQGMKFLGGFYAFPGGKVDGADAAPEALARCRGLDAAGAEAAFTADAGVPPLAYWVTAVRELVEESGVLLACDVAGRPVDPRTAATRLAVERLRRDLMAARAPFSTLLAREGWYCDLADLRYFSHFITPRASPIRFTARFFLCRAPEAQAPVLFTEETSEGLWIHPAEGYRRFRAGDLAMAEPAEYGLGYLAQFGSLAELWAAQTDGREKMHGLIDRIEFWHGFDWERQHWGAIPPGVAPPA